MGQGAAAIFGALIGGSVVIAGNITIEAYKRSRDRRGTASALAGEISAILHIATIRRHVAGFARLAELFEVGQEPLVPNVVSDAELELDPVAKTHLSGFGFLPGDLPERIVRFYTLLQGVRFDLRRLHHGEYRGRSRDAAGLIREDLNLWTGTIDPLGNQLVADLQLAAKPWHYRMAKKLAVT
jgi:hypothetical protein